MIVRTSILALMVLAGAVSAADEDRIEWTTWTSAEGKCEIMFPGKPKEMAGKDYALATFETMKDRVMYLVRAQTMSPAVPIDREALVGGRGPASVEFHLAAVEVGAVGGG